MAPPAAERPQTQAWRCFAGGRDTCWDRPPGAGICCCPRRSPWCCPRSAPASRAGPRPWRLRLRRTAARGLLLPGPGRKGHLPQHGRGRTPRCRRRRSAGLAPWERLLWLGNPALEDQYRAAVMSKQSTAFTVLKPPDQWLSFQLSPRPTASASTSPLPREQAAAEAEPCRTAPAGPLGASALYHLMYLAATLTQAVSVQDVVDQVADQLVPAFEAQGLVLMAAGTDGCASSAHAATTRVPGTLRGRSPGLRHPPARAIRTQTPAFFTSFTDFQRAYPEAPRYKDRDAWAFLPLIPPVAPSVFSSCPTTGPAFPVAERTVLASLAGLIAQALDRARLYDAQHHLARTLQTGLLPQELPTSPASRSPPATCPPATAWTSAATSTNSSTAPTPGPAASSATSRATTCRPPPSWPGPHRRPRPRPRRHLPQRRPGPHQPPADRPQPRAVHQLPLRPHRPGPPPGPPGHRRTPPPLIRHPDGRTETLPMTPGLLLGITPDADYPTTTVPLPPGTLLVLYTDGLVENPGTDIDATTTDLAHRLSEPATTTSTHSPTHSSNTPPTPSPAPTTSPSCSSTPNRRRGKGGASWSAVRAFVHPVRHPCPPDQAAHGDDRVGEVEQCVDDGARRS